MQHRIHFWLTLVLLSFAGKLLAAPSSQKPADRDAVCANCHKQIYESYEGTPMAHASGVASEGLIPGDFTHAASGIRYRLFLQDNHAWLSYQRPDATLERPLDGKQELLYYLGSGKRGRTYLFQQEGFWFEIPVNWYAKKRVWDMAPHYLQAREMPLTLPVDPGCLHCHASDVQPSLPGGRNHFAAQPFLHGGIGCSACHGDASVHLANGGKGPIVNPGKLDAVKRDSVCLQCHLEAESAIARYGHTLTSYRPGDNLFDHVIYFVRKDEIGAAGRATSQWEALLQSKCKEKSADRLTCTTCHDPHSSVAPEQRVNFYRSKCLSCHNDTHFVTKHHPENPDCAACHMPRKATEDIAHEQVTDHRIQRVHDPAITSGSISNTLVAINNLPAGAREYGLAYAQIALHGDAFATQQSLRYLKEAEHSDTTQSSDAELHTQLGFLAQRTGDTKLAEEEYQSALKADPLRSTAAGNLAVIRAQTGDLASAISLWETAFQHDPEQLAAGYDLAIVECSLGNTTMATRTLDRILLFSPDNGNARRLKTAIGNGSARCGRH
jgi:predicted CXXCH cytochrome family protein